MTAGLRVSDITPLGERPADIIRGRTGITVAGVATILGSPIVGGPANGDVIVYDSATDTWILVSTSTFGVPLTVEDEGTPLATAADTLNFVGAGVTATGAAGTKTITIPGGGLPWFDVTDAAYGAVGDGTTDDTAAINLAIAAMNTATKGVLYFPAGTYKVTAALTTITASGIILGDGMGAYDGSAKVSAVNFTSQTAVLFTITGKTVLFNNIGLFNTYAGTPSAGSAIHVDGSFIGQKVDLDSVVVAGFYDNVVRDVGAQWSDVNVWNWGPVRYGESIQNTVNQDAGDWAIVNCWYYADTYNGTAAIFQTGAGGGKIANVKINGHAGATFTNGVKIAIPNGVTTADFLLANTSIENISGDAVLITTTGTGSINGFPILGLQNTTSSNSGRAVKISAASNGVAGANGSIAGVVIDGVVARTDGTARAAIELVNTDRVTIGIVQLVQNFTSLYTSSGDTNTSTVGAVPAFAVPSITYGSPAAGAAATIIRSDATISPPTEAEVTFTNITTNNVSTSKHGYTPILPNDATKYLDGTGAYSVPVGSSATPHYLVIASSHSTPLVFGDLVQTSDGSDLIYTS